MALKLLDYLPISAITCLIQWVTLCTLMHYHSLCDIYMHRGSFCVAVANCIPHYNEIINYCIPTLCRLTKV